MNKMDGGELSVYRTIAIQVGQAKKEGVNGKKSKYAIFYVKNKKARTSKMRKILFFEEEEPTLIEGLLQFKQGEKVNDRYNIDMKALRESGDEDLMYGLWEFPGMQVVPYKLRKGLCYMNNADGDKVKTKDGAPLMVDTIQVLVQVDYVMSDGDKIKTIYVDGFDPDTQGQRMESRFFKETVETNLHNGVQAEVDDAVDAATTTQSGDPF